MTKHPLPVRHCKETRTNQSDQCHTVQTCSREKIRRRIPELQGIKRKADPFAAELASKTTLRIVLYASVFTTAPPCERQL